MILGYLEAFDPDILVAFEPKVPDFLSTLGLQIIRPNEVWKNADRYTPGYGLGIFDLLNWLLQDEFRYKTRFPVRVRIPALPEALGLFWSSFLGELPEKVASSVRTHYSEILDIDFGELEGSRLPDYLADDVLFLRRIALRGLRPVRRAGFHKESFVFYMDGSRVEDVVDFWNLRATGRAVLPLPRQLEGDPPLLELVTGFLKQFRRPWPHDPKVCDYSSIVRSRRMRMDDVEAFAKTLKIERDPADPSDDPFFSLQHWYPRIWDSWARGKDGVTPCDLFGEEEEREVSDSGSPTVRLKPLLPSFAREKPYRPEPCCTNEITFKAYGAPEPVAEVFPQTSGDNLKRAIGGEIAFRPGWRVGRNGLVKLISDRISEARAFPPAESIFFAWLRDNGWRPKLSPPGLLAKQIYKQLDGHPRVLARENVLGLLEHMSGGTVRKSDLGPKEVNTIGPERDLPVAEVKNRLGARPDRDDTYSFLLSKSVFSLGLSLQCPHCLRKSWVPVDSLRTTCLCPRCLQSFPAVGSVESSTWSYKTSGPFSVPGYGDGAYSVLLTLHALDGFRMSSLRTTPAFSFTAEAPSKKPLEADFGLLWQDSGFGETTEGAMFGECKTYGTFESNDVRRMRDIAKAFPGAVIVFSTLRKTLTKPEVKRIRPVVRTGRRYWKAGRPVNPVLILTRAELLGVVGPPSCWEEPAKTRFNRVHTFLQICDATQQIYLGLPSWEAEWAERRKTRRLRRASRKAPKSETPT